ncbi:MAG: replication factor C large subunit [Promethearchaeota archaeon]
MTKANNGNKNIPWVEKYRPQSISDMIGSEHIVKPLTDFLENFLSLRKRLKIFKSKLNSSLTEIEKKKLKLRIKSHQSKLSNATAAMLIGPPGVGKTTIVYALAHDFNLSVIEMNASDVRTEDAVNEKLKETVKSTNLLSFTQKKVKGKLILIDEVDGIHGRSDKGGVAALKNIISYSRFPIIMTCNFRDFRRFGDLYKLSSPLLTIKPARSEDIAKMLHKIVRNESINMNNDQIKSLAKKSQGDYRSAINDLQILAQGSTGVQDSLMESLNMQRDHQSKFDEGLRNLFKQETIRDAKRCLDEIDSKDISFNNLGSWINENIHNFITKKIDLYQVYQNLAYADTILGRIGRTQDYDHLSYFYDILAGGVRFSKTDSKISDKKLQSPRWFRFRAPANDEKAQKLQQIYHLSLNEIMREIRPYLAQIEGKDSKINIFLASQFQVEPEKVGKILKNR